MSWKSKYALCAALTFISVACISRRVFSLDTAAAVDVADIPEPTSSESRNVDDLDVSLEDDVLPDEVVHHGAGANPQADSLIPAVVEPIHHQDEPPSKSHPPCFPHEVLLVSTMDGKISALDLDRMEKPIWTVNTGTSVSSAPEPLLSASDTKIEAGAGWVIPSLDGMLYRFYTTSNERGDFLKSTAISSEEILERSIRLDEDSASSSRNDLTVYGSKETTIIGINARNGHVCYFCEGGSTGKKCSSEKAAVNDCGLTDEDDVIVVTRLSHTVKALKTRSGEPRWNYSVAQNHLKLQEGHGMESHFPPRPSSKSDVIITTCDPPSSGSPQPTGIDDLRFDVLRGRVVVGADPSSRRHEFQVPIANAWLVSNGKLLPINLFDAKNLAAQAQSSSPSNFLTFLGSFNDQYYLQHSSNFRDLVSLRNGRAANELDWVGSPVVNTEPKTPALTYERLTPPVKQTRLDNAVAIRTPAIVPGVYLRPANEYQLEIELSKLSGHSRVWRQVLRVRHFCLTSPFTSITFITIAMGFLVTLIVHYKQWREAASSRGTPSMIQQKFSSGSDSGFEPSTIARRSDSHSVVTSHSLPCLANYDNNSPKRVFEPVLPVITPLPPAKPIYVSSPSAIEFDSRFYQDFEPLKCLGKGGFGVVFEAKNRLDDCAYAIKRIALKNKPESKERVRREVMALAKLDHIGIVRYYHAWFESPPVGWDDPFLSNMTSFSTDMFSRTTSELEQVICSKPVSEGDGGARRPNDDDEGRNELPAENGSGDASAKVKRRDRYESLATKDLLFNNNHPEDSLDQVFQDVSLSVTNDYDDDDDKDDDDGFVRFPPAVSAAASSDSFSFRADSDYSALKSGGGGFSKFFSRRDSRLSTPSSPTLKNFGSDSKSDSTFDLVVFEHSEHNTPSKDPSGKLNVFLKSDDDDDDDDSEELCGPRGFFPTTEADGGEKEVESTPSRPSAPERKNTSGKIFLYIQMQLCRKETLKDWLRENVDRRHAAVLDIFAQIVDAVQFLHNQGLIHRDLKPSNIFFSASDGTVKIGDFGLVTAMVLDDPCLDDPHTLAVASPVTSSVSNQHTDQVGTKLYMSPEQSSGLSYSEKVDIYSLGIIFFELLHPMNTEMERGQTLTALREDNAIPESLRRKKKKESGLLLQMIHRDPAKRPAAEEVRVAVEELESLIEDDCDAESSRGRRRHKSFSRGSSKSNGSRKSTADLDDGEDDSLIEFANL